MIVLRDFTYVLVGQTPVPERDFAKWAMWHGEIANRRVASTELDGGVEVSTVFTGVVDDPVDPKLFETMVFSGGEWGHRQRCRTWLEAEAQHARAVTEWRNRQRV